MRNQQQGRLRRSSGKFATAMGPMVLVALAAAAVAAAAQAQTLSVLYNFKDQNDGYQPMGQPYVDKKGNVFGTAQYDPPSNDGNVWEVGYDGTFKVLHAFPVSGGDGTIPFSNLAVNAAGTMFGTTVEGGTYGGGTVFSIDRNGNFKVLHTFTNGTTDGCNSYGGAVLDQSGNVYGMTDGCGAYGHGTVWRVNTDGSDTLLHSFTGSNDGERPFYGNLYRDKDGSLFGVAEFGGDKNCGCGVFFEIDTSGTYTVLHTFVGGTDGADPVGAVLRDKNYVYGTASLGGPTGNGTIWKYDLATGKYKTLYSFATSDGTFPMGLACQLKNAEKVAPACVAGQNGSRQPVLYGTTPSGGANNQGTLWELDSTGQFHKLWDFGHWNGSYYIDGAEPISPPFADAKGNLYGTADFGGTRNAGAVWKFTP